jgi:hypothetical protein
MAWEDGTNPDPNSYGTSSSARVAYSDDEGTHWSKPVDLSTRLGVHNVQFPQIVAGDKGRAAVSFIGTDAIGDDQHVGFVGKDKKPAVWHLYVGLTYDGGKHWNVQNVTPHNVVQRGCVLMEGTSNKTAMDQNLCDQRNMLDFNDITVDKKGRVLAAWTDGCVAACERDPATPSHDEVDMLTRLSAGKGLVAKYDGKLGKVPSGTTGYTASALFLLPLAATVATGRRRSRR